MTRAAWIAVVSLALAPLAAAKAQPETDVSPDLFIGRLFARYTVPAGFETMQPDYPQIWEYESHYAPELIALFNRLEALAATDEVPEFADGDHLCQCQDWENFRLLRRDVRTTGDGQAEARLSFRNAGERKRTRLVLVRTPVGWRITDVYYDLYPGGLAAAMRTRIAAIEAERAAR